MEKAMMLLEDVERAERELNNFMESNSTLEDLEVVRFLQEQVQDLADKLIEENPEYYLIGYTDRGLEDFGYGLVKLDEQPEFDEDKAIEDAYQNADQVNAAIDAKITELNLANTYDAKGAAAQALVDAKAYTDEEINTKIVALSDEEIDEAIAAVIPV